MESLTIVTCDASGQFWNLEDAAPPKIKNSENGFAVCNFALRRAFDVAWYDIAPNFQCFAFSSRGDIAWHGRIDSVEPGFDGISVGAFGYWASGYDEYYQGTISASPASPENLITQLLSKLPNIASTSFYATGLTGRSYQTPNGGTDAVRVADAILAICNWGDNSSPTKRVVPAVWTDRQLITYAVTTQSPVADYIVPRRYLSSFKLRKSLSSVANRVTVRYVPDSGGTTLQSLPRNNTTSQGALGVAYTSGGSKVNFVREQLLDMTGFTNGVSPTAAQIAGDQRLNETSRLRADAQNITISTEYSVFSVAEGQEIPLWKVRAGKWLRIPDLLNRPSDSGGGSTVADAALQTLFYITEAEYDATSGTLTLVPEEASSLASLVS